MKIIRKNIDQITASEIALIDQFVEINNGLIFHEIDFNVIVAETFNTSLFYALAYEREMLIGICPIHRIKKGFLQQSFSGPSQFEVPYGGWVYNKKFTSFNILFNNFSLKINEVLTYCSSILLNEEDISASKSINYKYYSGLIDLSKTEQELWESSIHSKRRNKVRKAEKNGITVEISGIDKLDIFFSLLLEMNAKAGIRSKINAYYEKILKKYYPFKCSILLASFEGVTIAGNMLIGNKNMIHYWQGASKLGIVNNGQGELLQWEGIKWAKSTNSKFYDLCVIEPERLPHIAQFKMGFVNELVPYYCFIKKQLSFRILNKIQKPLIRGSKYELYSIR